jgi:hypothetical protein
MDLSPNFRSERDLILVYSPSQTKIVGIRSILLLPPHVCMFRLIIRFSSQFTSDKKGGGGRVVPKLKNQTWRLPCPRPFILVMPLPQGITNYRTLNPHSYIKNLTFNCLCLKWDLLGSPLHLLLHLASLRLSHLRNAKKKKKKGFNKGFTNLVLHRI